MNSNMKSVLRNYIQNCGEGRGLDKFLRRNSYSSDERDTASPITTGTCRSKHKSLENLNEAAKKEENLRKSPPKSQKERTPVKDPVPEPTKPMEGTKVVVKQTGEKVDKKKTFNYESVIEITLPPQQQPASFPVLPHTLPDLPKDISFGEEKPEEPIKPIICTPKSAKIPPHHNSSDKKISPSSGNDEESFVSNKQNPMEWDDFIPGYDTEISQLENTSMQLCNNNPMELNDNELNALKTYFHQRGLQLPNENLIVVIKNRHEKVSESERALEHIRRNKEKWQNIYEKYKDKYQPQQQTTINFEEIEAQSTPKIPEMSSGSSKTAVVNEKGSQTSLIRSSAKSVQVESSSINRNQYKNSNKDVAALNTIESKTEDFDVYQNHSEIAESFEFVQGPKRKESGSSKESSHSKKSTSMATEAGSSKISVLSESLKNEDIANFDDSLKVAIALLNSLLDSNMRPELKRNLAEKVIQKITQLQTSKSIQTSTIDSTNSSKCHVDKKSMKEKSSRPKSRDEALKDCLAPMTKSEYSHQNSQSTESSNKESFDTNSIPKSQLMDFVKREKQSQLKWIEKEIEHLNNLRDLLKRNETSLSLSENCPIYENLSSIKTKEKSLRSESEKKAATATDMNFWNSHANMKKIKNRSKMELPKSDLNVSQAESLASFIDSRNKKFLEKYSQHQKKLDEESNAYTQPNSHNSQDPQVRSKSTRRTHMTANKDVQTSTSLASSSVFESSDMSNVPSSSAKSNTKSTTHKAVSSKEHKQKVAVTQTTDSICRTRPIYEVRDKDDVNFGTTSTTVTKRIQKHQNDKQLQAQPSSIKYTLTFDKKSKPKIRPYSSLPQKSNDYGTISKSSKDIYNQISYSASLNYHYEENKENYDNDILFDDADEDVDLQKCFKKRPDIFSRFEQRKNCIEELRKLRALRNEHRAKLLLLTSDKSLEGKLFNSLPELPLRQTRMFSTKALKLQTKKVVKNLTEVKQKKKEENLKNLKRKTRLMTEIFNKNLQRNVLKGNLNLSNTVNLITK
ncbi:centrosome-associated protein Alms1a-like [Chironomus tepperi]|uniref:centrosome-associated protein Alms1a-like n=1 Tax=Chironomus tepperi TaxID=113505 RepID=UPI00391EF856